MLPVVQCPPPGHTVTATVTSTALGGGSECQHPKAGAAGLVPMVAGVSPGGSGRVPKHRLHSGTWADPAQPLAALGAWQYFVLTHPHGAAGAVITLHSTISPIPSRIYLPFVVVVVVLI